MNNCCENIIKKICADYCTIKEYGLDLGIVAVNTETIEIEIMLGCNRCFHKSIETIAGENIVITDFEFVVGNTYQIKLPTYTGSDCIEVKINNCLYV